MLSRSSRRAAGLLSYRLSPACRERPLFLTSRRHEIFVRYNSTPTDDKNTRRPRAPRYGTKSSRRRKLEDQNGNKSVPLDVNFLGEPGEIVLVPDRDRRRRTQEIEGKPSENADENELPFFLGELEKEDTIIDNTIVNERIESFALPHQPKDKLSTPEWEGLRFKVQSSFTYTQLSDYIADFKQRELDLKQGDLQHEGVNTAVWKPGTSLFLETDPASQENVTDRVATSRALRGKKLLAERILRDCWQLGVIDEVGQLDIRLPSHSISLFLNSEHFSFEELAGLHEAKIDITRSLGLVRVTGSQHACKSIREIIYDAAARIREEEIELYPPGIAKAKSDRSFSSDFLKWVSTTYGVAFGQSSSPGPDKIFYLAENKKDGDNARRTLNLALYHKNTPPVPFSTYFPASEPASVYNVDPERNTSWFDRKKSWFRWATPSTQSARGEGLASPLFDKHQTRLSDQLLKLLRRPSPGATNFQNAPGTHETITASVGKCLFLHKPTFEDETVNASELGSMSLPRTFTTDIPRATSFVRGLTPGPDDEDVQLHRIRLMPSAINANIFPQLDLEVAVAENNSEPGSGFVVRSAKAILAERSVHYLLPENGLDLQFTRKLYRDVLNESPGSSSTLERAETTKESIHGCLKGIFSGSMAKDVERPLPQFCHISLPKELLQQGLLETGNAEETKDSGEYATGEYMFQPVNDIRGTHIHRYDFYGHQLTYAFYESGPFLPYRTTDLFLDMNITGSSGTQAEIQPVMFNSSEPQDLVSQEFNSFYSSACKLAFELDNPLRIF